MKITFVALFYNFTIIAGAIGKYILSNLEMIYKFIILIREIRNIINKKFPFNSFLFK